MQSKSKKKIRLGAVVQFRLPSGSIATGTIVSVRETTSGVIVLIRHGDLVNSVHEQDIVRFGA